MWIFLGTLIYIVFWLTCIASYTVHYLSDTIQIASFSQVLYTLSAGTEGAEGTVGNAVGGFFRSYWLLLLIGTVIFGYYIYLCIKRRQAKKSGVSFFPAKKAGLVFNCSVLGAAVVMSTLFGSQLYQGWQVLGIGEYMENASRSSSLYDDHYVEPADATLTFPEKKKNLVHIVVESLESSFTDKEHGGGYEHDLIPGLYELAKSGTDFSPEGTVALNGANVTNNSGWTVAGLVAMSAGVPLNVGNGEFNRNFGGSDKFMPHLGTMGELLEDNGYKNYFMCGSDGAFAGRSNYYTQHGNYEILDYGAAVRAKAIPDNYRVWWGFEDQKLFSWAEKKLPEIAASGQPFNFTLLTADTHFPDGYKCPNCKDEFDSQYQNVINCTDRQLTAFVKWLQQQPFYKDTTVVITGDHLSMDGSVAKTAGEGYTRHAFACVLNSPEYTINKTRDYCTLDLFPTIMEAMGIQIDGHRLGLGTSLYSDLPTLIEQMGLLGLNAELTADSDYYNRVIMSGDQTKQVKKETAEVKDDKTSEDKASEEPAKEDLHQVETPDGQRAVLPQYYAPTEETLNQQGYQTVLPETTYQAPAYTAPDYGYVEEPTYQAPAVPSTPVTPEQPSAPSDPAPVDPAPVDPAPSDPAPVDPAPVDPAPSDPNPGTPSEVPTVPSVPADPSVPSVPADPSAGTSSQAPAVSEQTSIEPAAVFTE